MDLVEWLGNVLVRVDSYPGRGYALYVEGEWPFSVQSRALVLERDLYSDALPNAAVLHGLRYALSMVQALDVVANARAQRPDVDAAGLVDAINFYWKRDAYIVFRD